MLIATINQFRRSMQTELKKRRTVATSIRPGKEMLARVWNKGPSSLR